MSTASNGREGIEVHGIPLDKYKSRVQCRYCTKVVTGFNRLKHHLGGLGGDVTPCSQAPEDIKSQMRYSLLEKKKERLLKEVDKIYHPELPLKRKFVAGTETSSPEKGSPPLNSKSFNFNGIERENNFIGILKEESTNKTRYYSTTTEDTRTNTIIKEEAKDSSNSHVERCIGRFFYEAGIDLKLMKSPSFQGIIDAVIASGAGSKIPTYGELGGWILQDELREVNEHVARIKLSWEQTGCSILLDGWIDQKGRNLIAFLVDCPNGTIFLRSVDASYAVHDVDSLVSLVSNVIEEVGVKHVIQVIAHDTSCYMEAAGKKLMDKYRNIFWSLCADYCINLILDKIGAIDHVKKVVSTAKTITQFIYSHAIPLQLMKKHIGGKDLVKSTQMRSISTFMTLENMVMERENLILMFNSPEWLASSWSIRSKGKSIADLVRDTFFWDAAGDVVKITAPLLGVLRKLNKNDAAPMGFLYDALDRAKEIIKVNLAAEEVRYLPLWVIIDDIWDNYLHSPLHSAGYYLNPSLFYSGDFFVDAEVTNGLLCCIIRMVWNQQDQELVVRQLDAYKAAIGGFAEDAAINERTKVAPASWWASYGGHSPELQKLAVTTLSQTCSATARYKLKKSLSEQVHAKGRNCIEQQRICDFEFVHNNLRLWQLTSNTEQRDRISLDDLNPLNDWIVEGIS